MEINSFKNLDTNTYVIEKINFQHPLYSNVFDGDFKEIKYPKVSYSYSIDNIALSNKILSHGKHVKHLP